MTHPQSSTLVITKVNYTFPDTSNPKYLAKCSVVFNDQFKVYDIELVADSKGNLIIIMPTFNSKKENSEAFHPLSRDYFTYLKDTLIEGYHFCISKKCHRYLPSFK